MKLIPEITVSVTLAMIQGRFEETGIGGICNTSLRLNHGDFDVPVSCCSA